jgi:DNA-binding transcriptional LysR family regulator
MGIGYSPDWLFEDELRNGEVVRILPDWNSPKSPIHLLTPVDRKNSAKVKAFAEFMLRNPLV